jgi:hypothetical protein
MAETYLGYRDADRSSAWAEYFKPEMAPLPRHVVTALEHGPQAEPVLPRFEDAAALLTPGYEQTEDGYGSLGDGGVQVSVRTEMPGVTPQMWSWWFGWHGSRPSRYKLWHPRAHVSACWNDSEPDGHYVGRTSLIEEYIGSGFTKGAISFVEPGALGLDEQGLGSDIAICGRIGAADLPVDIGWLIHYVRSVPGGSEMRSRFWMGGRHVAVRGGNRLADRVIRPVAARQLPNPRDLLVHCAQEMNHLAGILPGVHSRFALT